MDFTSWPPFPCVLAISSILQFFHFCGFLQQQNLFDRTADVLYFCFIVERWIGDFPYRILNEFLHCLLGGSSVFEIEGYSPVHVLLGIVRNQKTLKLESFHGLTFGLEFDGTDLWTSDTQEPCGMSSAVGIHVLQGVVLGGASGLAACVHGSASTARTKNGTSN